MASTQIRFRALIVLVLLTICVVLPRESYAGFSLGQGTNYAVLVEPNLHNFGLTSDSGIFGNVGIGSPINAVGLASGIIQGNLDFSGAQSSGGPNFGGTVTGSVTSNVAAVTSALNTVNSLSSTLSGESGTPLTISGSGQTVNASSGMLDASGNEVFSVASNGFRNNSGGFTINGTASQFVVININNGTSNETIGGPISLTGGITSDHVLFNFSGTGGELHGSANGATANGVFLAPNMKINVDNTIFDGRLFGGGSSTSNNDFQIVSNAYVVQPVSVSCVCVPEPASITTALIGGMSLGLVGVLRWRRRKKVARSASASPLGAAPACGRLDPRHPG
jgi:hypothetical protein